MTSFIEKITEKGIRAIADEIGRGYVSVLASKDVTIDGKRKTEADLLNIYNDNLEYILTPRKSGFALFCEHHREQLQRDGHDFQHCAVKLGQMWNDCNQDEWEDQAKYIVRGNRFIGRHCKFWYEATEVEDDCWVGGCIESFNHNEMTHTVTYTDPLDHSSQKIKLNIFKWIDDDCFQWIDKETFESNDLDDDFVDEDDDDDDDDDDGENDEDGDERENRLEDDLVVEDLEDDGDV